MEIENIPKVPVGVDSQIVPVLAQHLVDPSSVDLSGLNHLTATENVVSVGLASIVPNPLVPLASKINRQTLHATADLEARLRCNHLLVARTINGLLKRMPRRSTKFPSKPRPFFHCLLLTN